jgi:hypothetical protein
MKDSLWYYIGSDGYQDVKVIVKVLEDQTNVCWVEILYTEPIVINIYIGKQFSIEKNALFELIPNQVLIPLIL